MWNAISKHFKTKTTKSISFNYKWTIDNYSRLYDVGHPWKWKICSKNFSPSNNQLFDFELYLYPKGECETVKDYVSIGVNLTYIPQTYYGKIKCRWNVSIVDESGENCETGEMDSYDLYADVRILPDLIQYSQLLSNPKKYLPNDQLKLYFEIHLQADDHIFNVITNNELGTSRFDCAQMVSKVVHSWTVENFGKLFESSDVTPYFIQSDKFSSFNEQSEQFCLRLYPNGLSEERKDCVDIVILNDNQNSATVHWRMSILDVDGEVFYAAEKTGKIKAKKRNLFSYNRASLLDNLNGLVVNNKLRILYEMSYMMDDKPKTAKNTQLLDYFYKSESLFDVNQKTIHFVAHHWTIEKFSTFCLSNQSIDTPILKPPTNIRFEFLLRLWPNGHDEHSRKYLSLDLYNVSPNIKQATVQYRLSLLDAIGNKRKICSGQSSISKNDKVRLPKIIHQSYFQYYSKIKQYLPNDKLTILCELWIIQHRKIYKRKNIAKPSDAASNSPGPAPSIQMNNVNIQGYFQVNSTSSIEGNVDLKVENS